MSCKIKGIDIKSHTYYFFDAIINVKNVDPNNILLHWIRDNRRFKM